MTTATSGPMGRARDNFAAMLADCPTFQAWCGAAAREQALARIHFQALPKPASGPTYTLEEMQAYRPMVVLWVEPGPSGFARQVAGQGMVVDKGEFLATFEEGVPDDLADDPAELETRFLNTIDGIIQDLTNLRWPGAGYLAWIQIEKSEGPIRAMHQETVSVGDHQYITLTVTYGTLR